MNNMNISDTLKRILVVLLRIKPKILTPEEKEKIREKMIKENRAQDRDITTCKKELAEGLEMEEVMLPHCSGWLVKKEGNPKDRIVYYIHGGGFVNSCTKARMSFVSYIVKNFGYDVFSIDYRLAPEYMYPCAPSDCLDGYEMLLKSYDSKNIVLIGESAGGTLSLVLSLMLRDRGLPLPAAVYANSPAAQLAEYTESYRKFSLKRDFIVTEGIVENTEGIYFKKGEERDPYVSPLYGDLGGLPPIWLTASSCECLLDDSVMMHDKLKSAGNDCVLLVYDNLCHAFIISPQMKDVVRKAYPDLKTFLDKYL